MTDQATDGSVQIQHRALARTARIERELRLHAARVARGRCLPGRAALGQFGIGHVQLQLHVSDEELAKRKAAWTKPAPRYTRGVLAKFAKNAASASFGAVLDKFE